MPTLNKTIDELLIEYQLQLSELEHVVIKIAQEHLESSFSLEKSIGFKKWYDKKYPKA